jgi:hypothetical protein
LSPHRALPPAHVLAGACIDQDVAAPRRPLGGQRAGVRRQRDLSIKTGAAQIVKVDGKSKRMRVYADGKLIRTFLVSLGKADILTYAGTAVVIGTCRPGQVASCDDEPPARSAPHSPPSRTGKLC